jgi:hypothetical protein
MLMKLMGTRSAFQGIVALVEVAFGIATVVAGTRVLAGADPGFVVFRPLVVFNVAMGVAYVAAGIWTSLSLERGRVAAAAIFLLNLVAFGLVGYLYAAGSRVAVESVRAIAFRTGVWLVLFLSLVRLARLRRVVDR